MELNLGLVAIIITLLIIVGAVVTRHCVEFMICRLHGSSDFLLWKRISGRMESVTSGYAGRECMGDAGMPVVWRSDQSADRFQRKLRIFQIYFKSLQYRAKNTDDNIYHGNPDLRR